MILRPASLADVRELAAFGRRSFTDTFGHFYAPGDLAAFLATARAPDKVSTDVQNPETGVMLATDGDDLLGYCTINFDGALPNVPNLSRLAPAC